MVMVLIGTVKEERNWIRKEKRNGRAWRYTAVRIGMDNQIMLVWGRDEKRVERLESSSNSPTS